MSTQVDYVTQVKNKSAAFISTDYDFTAQRPGGSLAAGDNTITLHPVPRGVNGSDANHYLYISNGTGTAEAVLITGGTAVSGANSGTVVITCANSHSGAWTVRSATAGIQEAICAVVFRGSVYVPPGNHDTYATVTVPADKNVEISGAGPGATSVRSHADGDTVYYAGNDFGIMNVHGLLFHPQITKSAGAEVHVYSAGGGFAFLSDIHVLSAYAGIHLENVNTCNVSSVEMNNILQYGIYMQAHGVGQLVSAVVTNVGIALSGDTGTGLYMLATDSSIVGSSQLTNVILQNGEYNWNMEQVGASSVLGEFTVNGLIVDSAAGVSIRAIGASGVGRAFGLAIANLYGGTNKPNARALDIESFANINITGGQLAANGTGLPEGITLRGCTDVNITGLRVTAGGSAVFVTADSSSVVSTLIHLYSNRLVGKYGLTTSAAAHTHIDVQGGRLEGTTSDLNWNASGVGSRLGNVIYSNGTGKPDATTYGAALRGSQWFTTSAGGSADKDEILTKDAADAYAWRTRI